MTDTQSLKNFETTPMNIMVEEISITQSAFAVNEKGDTVFLNARLVERMNIDHGEVLLGYSIPNYEDKRANTPWRCIHVEQNESHYD